MIMRLQGFTIAFRRLPVSSARACASSLRRDPTSLLVGRADRHSVPYSGAGFALLVKDQGQYDVAVGQTFPVKALYDRTPKEAGRIQTMELSKRPVPCKIGSSL